jgi:hypothetical protein
MADVPVGRSTIGILRALWHRFRKYWPEIAAFVAMMAYTLVRTLFVAHGVDSVAHTDWRVFLLIEVVFTVPYVWGIGDLVRGAMLGTHSRRREWLGIVGVLSGVIAPYAYLAAFGGLQHAQSAVITLTMIALAMVGLRKSLQKLSNAKKERVEREHALEVRMSETQRLRELEQQVRIRATHQTPPAPVGVLVEPTVIPDPTLPDLRP